MPNTSTANNSPGDRERFFLLTAALGIVILVWVGHAIGATFGWWNVPFWKIWEVSSVIVALCVTIAFWRSYIWGKKDKDPKLDDVGARNIFMWIVWLTLSAIGFGGAAYCAWTEQAIVIHVLLLVLGVLSTVMLAQTGLSGFHRSLGKIAAEYNSAEGSNKALLRKRARERIGDRDNVTKFLCFSDAPIAFAMIVLALFSIFYSLCSFEQPLEALRETTAFKKGNMTVGEVAVVEGHVRLQQLRAAIAGAVGLQLLYSNIVYWIEAFADTPWGGEVLEKLPPALSAIRLMLRPDEALSDSEIERELTRIRLDSTHQS